ncbi:hypothetical protein B9Z55_008366 [Caenorhabditis nigoni]|uniref:W02B3.4-like N-terminal domain-containing protein n=2 Tax=Caenorhabditis nigoni TaxID=1611254 RepID=A0A2G5UMH4_9PELO|nr:hypothetical protein B9Z55_008366 [Caenorhabditis nigoni]
MRKYLVYFSVPCFFIFPMLFVYQASLFGSTQQGLSDENDYPVDVTHRTPQRVMAFMKRSPKSCESWISQLNTSIPVLLIDVDLLKALEKNNCGSVSPSKSIMVGVDVTHLSATWLLTDPRFVVLYYTNETGKDYLDFRSDPRKIIPKKFETRWVGNVEIPVNIPRFLGFSTRGKFIDCMNLHIPRTGMKVRMPAKPSSAALAHLRDELIENNMFPFLNGGTLLGWYRECSVIPHTADMDLSVFAENYNPEFVDKMEKNQSGFRISRKFGMINDSFELTLAPKEGFKVYIDIFLMYQGVENGTVTHNWVGGLSPDGTKYKYSYPVYDPWCAADLHGHIFWVTCTPNEKIVKEYGALWYLDHLTSKYSWNSSGKNVKKNGKWTKDQMKDVYKVFKGKK